MKRILKQIIDDHNFFCCESLRFVGKLEWHDKGTKYEYFVPKYSFKKILYWPIAWYRFMKLCSVDWK